jgi:hypothetical protein
MKSSVKAFDKNSNGLNYLKQKFPKSSDTRLQEGISIGPQIRKPLHETVSNST